MVTGTALAVGAAGAAGSMMGASAARKNAKAAQKVQLLQFWEDQNNRQKIKDQYADTKKTWQEYSPQYLEGATMEGQIASQIADENSAWQKYLNNEATGSLGLGYQKATESIMPELYGQTMPIIENLQEKVLPYARSAAIDQGAYGGARDYLTRERLIEDAEDTVISQGLQDLQNQRAQTAALLNADTESLNRYLSTALSPAQLTMQSAKDKQYTSDYLWDLATEFGTAVGAGTQAPYSSIDPSVYSTQGGLNGLGTGLQMGASLAGLFAGSGGNPAMGATSSGGSFMGLTSGGTPMYNLTGTAKTGGNVIMNAGKYMG